jgi:NTP pyrophosphatase (non-canonical NTP hydrolase)
MELADILFVVVVLANQLGIDLQTALETTLAKYETRDADRWERK